MNGDELIMKEVRAALEHEPRVNVHKNHVDLQCAGGVVTMTGVMTNVAAKKLALENAAAVAGVSGLVDRLSVQPSEILEDAELGQSVFNALLQESAFADFTLRASARGSEVGFRGTPREPTGTIEAEVVEGVVTLTGMVESYAHKALAGVLAWWKRGTRNVLDCIDVEHAMQDPDGEMTDALRIVLEKDTFVHEGQIRAVCRDFIVTLDGVVAKEGERQLAEADAWYLFGVNDVVNNLIVRA